MDSAGINLPMWGDVTPETKSRLAACYQTADSLSWAFLSSLLTVGQTCAHADLHHPCWNWDTLSSFVCCHPATALLGHHLALTQKPSVFCQHLWTDSMWAWKSGKLSRVLNVWEHDFIYKHKYSQQGNPDISQGIFKEKTASEINNVNLKLPHLLIYTEILA